MKAWQISIFLLLSLVLISSASCNPFARDTSGTTTQLVEVLRGDLSITVSGSGNIAFSNEAKLSFGINGKVDRIYVSEGDRVVKGKVLAELETDNLERAVKTAELAVKSDEVDLRQAEDSVKVATIDLEQASDNYRKITYPYTYSTFAFDVPTAIGAIDEAERQLKAAEEGLKMGLGSGEFGEAWDNFRKAQDNLVNAKERLLRGQGVEVFVGDGRLLPQKDFWTIRAAQLTMEKAQLAVVNAKSVVNKAELAVTKAKYDLETAKEALDRVVIIAPFDGIIAKANIKAGDTFTSVDYTKTAFELIDPTAMELKVKVDEMDIAQVKPGQKAIIKLDALPHLALKGMVSSIGLLPVEEAGVIVYEVKIDFDITEDSGIRGGMSATTDIIVAERTNVLLVPGRAISSDSGGKPVVEVTANGKIEERPVAVGISDGLQTEVLDGLQEGDKVIERRAAPQPTGIGLY